MAVDQKYRIYVTLKPETIAVVTKLARVMGRPRSGIISDMVNENAEALDQLADAILLARRAEETAGKAWRGDLTKAARRAHDLALEADKIITDLADTLGDGDGAGRPARPSGRGVRAQGADAVDGG